MQTAPMAIVILSALDIGVLILAYRFDRKYYKAQPMKRKLRGHFFVDKTFDEPLNRFALSKGGMMILSLVFVAVLLLTRFAHGTV